MFELMLAQFGGQRDWTSTVIWLILFIVFMLFGQRLLTTQSILKLERDAVELERLADKSRGYVIRSISKKPSTQLKESVKSFMEFFAVSPVDIDPYGIVKKIDYLVRQADKRFKYFVMQIAPDLPKNRQADMKNALAGAITTHQIAKIVRHYLELIKKYKLFQLALVIQMQIPLIVRVAKAAMHATHAFVEELPIGDGIGPLVIANMMNGKAKIYEDEEFAVLETKIAGRKVFIAKADGPGASTGYPGKFLQKLLKKQKINRIITVDAGLRLEGEEAGTVAEGVGVAMGGTGVDRYEIEEIAVKKNIPLDAIAIKVSDEEALMPMVKKVVDSVPKAVEIVKKTIARTGKNERILLIGVGNSCGIGNNSKEASITEKKIREHIQKVGKIKERKSFLDYFSQT